ncbi:hypothetical protein [Vulcaniibacterium gelatinicum]|uniref:hypothetical protein n=1 Tax=Vulcaniibacterium gelatinicum TaxID=2598725 RepID=UPI0011C7D83F|nr:hypothetical protein [Vulcaniibacterium gelatinicum]
MKDVFFRKQPVPYRGPDRRQTLADRRQQPDRRAEARFEPGRLADRRSGEDRRKSSHWLHGLAAERAAQQQRARPRP